MKGNFSYLGPTTYSSGGGGGGGQEAFLTYTFAGGDLMPQTQNPGFDATRIQVQMGPFTIGPTDIGVMSYFALGTFPVGAPNLATLQAIEHFVTTASAVPGVPPFQSTASGSFGNVIDIRNNVLGIVFTATVVKTATGIEITPSVNTFAGRGDFVSIGMLVR